MEKECHGLSGEDGNLVNERVSVMQFVNRFMYIMNSLRFSFGRKSFALDELDRKAAAYIRRRNGFFVEVGANDGINQSNTLYFERYLGWCGLLIEPIPELAEKCRRNRPRCLVENCALVAADYPEDTIEMRYCNLMSIVKGAMGGGEQEEQHIRSGMRFLRESERVYTVEVPARTLSWVLDKYNVEHIDLLSLDVEGYEEQVLKGIDFDRHRPEYMLIEVRRRQSVESIIKPYYTLVDVLQTNKSYSDVLYKRLQGCRNGSVS